MKAITAALVLVALAGAPTGASAEDNTARFLKLYTDGSSSDRQMVETYLSNVQTGFYWANRFLEMSDRPKLFCTSDVLTLTGAQLLETVRLQVKADPRGLLLPLGFTLLVSMQTTYPCK